MYLTLLRNDHNIPLGDRFCPYIHTHTSLNFKLIFNQIPDQQALHWKKLRLLTSLPSVGTCLTSAGVKFSVVYSSSYKLSHCFYFKLSQLPSVTCGSIVANTHTLCMCHVDTHSNSPLSLWSCTIDTSKRFINIINR